MSVRKRNITGDFLLVVVVVLIGKALGFVRELIVAYIYGSSIATDAFYYVNSLVLAVLAIITMGLGQAFTPTYLDMFIKRGEGAASSFSSKIISILIAFGALFSIVLIGFPDAVLSLLAPDMSLATEELARTMLRVLAPCIPVYIAFSIRKCILNAHEKYIVTEASGIPYSIVIVLLTLVLFAPLNAMALPIAAFVGIVFQYLFTFFFSRADYRFKPPKSLDFDEDVKGYFLLLAPIAISALLEQANGLLRKALAAGMGVGAIANLNYCMTLTSIIDGIVITSITTVYLPHLTKNHSEGNDDEFSLNLSKCLSLSSALVVPLVLFMFAFSTEIVQLVYERGSFTRENTLAVGSLFAIYILGSIIYSYRSIIKTAFFATKNAKSPMMNEAIYLVLCMFCNIVQVKVFGMGLEALGIAWVISIAVTTPFLFRSFKILYFNPLTKSVCHETVKAFCCIVPLVVLVLALKTRIMAIGTLPAVFASFLVVALAYFLLMLLVRSTSMTEIASSAIRRFKRG